MAGIEQKIFSGIMNTDDSNDVMPPTHHKLAYNIRFRGNQGNFRPEKCLGTNEINFNLPTTGTNEWIGVFYDSVKQRMFWFNYNSEGYDGIYILDTNTLIVTPLLISLTNSSTPLFNFSLSYPIVKVNIIYASDSDGDTLFWITRNNRPQKLNIKQVEDGIYGNNWVASYLTVARPMPLIAPSCQFADDGTVDINNLRKKLYEFKIRYVNRDNTKSTCSPYSKLFAPPDPDSIATDIDPQKNNRIDVTITTGDADVIAIEIIARQTLATTYSDCFLVTTLNKEELSIGNNVLYIYPFYNDQSYPYIDLEESIELFDYVPKLTNTQELLNGNVLIYGGITEGYDFNETLDVTSSVTTVENDVVEDPVLITVQNNQTGYCPNHYSGTLYYYFTGTPQTGDVYSLTAVVFDCTNFGHSFTVSHTVTLGENLPTIVADLRNQFNAATGFNLTYHLTAGNVSSPDGVTITTTTNTSTVLTYSFSITYATPPPPATNDVNIACYHPKSKYAFGLVYFDKYGVTNGVVYQNTMLIETPELDTTGNTEMKIPAISFEINHQPPDWAYYYAWVRTDSLTFGNTLTTVTCSTEKDADFGYLEITNQQNNQQNYPAYDFKEGDRVRIIGIYGGSLIALDFPIISFVTDPVVGGVSKTGLFITVPYDTALSTFGTDDNWYIEIYTPASNVDSALQVYYEFGENYYVLNPTTEDRYHAGQIQDQTALLPAKFTFTRADFYIRQRVISNKADLTANITEWIIDRSVSDKYPSKVSGTGRPFISDKNAKENYFPTLLRWSLSYQPDTSINQTNRFYGKNFDEIDRAKGDIEIMTTIDRYLKIGQTRAWAQHGVYAKFVQDSGGNNILTTTDEIITSNNVQYIGEYGVGNQYLAYTVVNGVIYFSDPVRGYDCRLSQDGITQLNEIYKGKYYIKNLLTKYNSNYIRADGGNAMILKAFDYFEGNVITVLQSGTANGETINNYTFSFNEERNAYESFYNYYPTIIVTGQDKLFTGKQGGIYIHNNDTDYCKFYGVQYNASITVVYNDKINIKKTFRTISYQSNSKWASPTNGNIITSQLNDQTGLPQISSLIEKDYDIEEGLYYAALLFDANSKSDSRLALLEGDELKGVWLEVTYICRESGFSFLYLPTIKYDVSQLNF